MTTTRPTAEATAKRLPAAERRAQILLAGRRVLARDGVDRFSLEEVAREAGVAATLPRHYFHSRDGLLVETIKALILDTVEPLLRRDPTLTLAERYRLYISHISEHRWGHTLWLGAESVHPDLAEMVRDLRRLLISRSFGRRWDSLSPAEKVHAAGWIGYFSTAVAEWIDLDSDDQTLLLQVLLDGARRFGIKGA